MSEEIFKVMVPLVIALLIIWLIYRIRRQIKFIIKNEIYENFPVIKGTIEDFEHRTENLKAQIDILEQKIAELERRRSQAA